MNNLLLIHLESISWQTVRSFPEAFPNLRRVMSRARVFNYYFSSATSTVMAMAYLCHANNFEMDAGLTLCSPAGNNPSLFTLLSAAGYDTSMLCVSALKRKKMLGLLDGTVPPVWSSGDYREALAALDRATDRAPFAVYWWNLVTHIDHAMALARHAAGPDDLIGGACAVADHAIGELLSILDRKGLTEKTTLVLFGDHGELFWTHGFKAGLLHGVEPYTPIIHTPLIIGGPGLPPGEDNRLVSTIDLAPTCLDLLGIPAPLPFAHGGRSLMAGGERRHCFSQNFTASQPDAPHIGVTRAFSVSDHAYTLLVNRWGLALYNHRLDPANQTNLLHFFDLDAAGGLVFRAPPGATRRHFSIGMGPMLERAAGVPTAFRHLHGALLETIEAKNAYAAERTGLAGQTLDIAALHRINRDGRDRFFAPDDGIATGRAS